MNKEPIRNPEELERWKNGVEQQVRGNTSVHAPESYPCVAVWTITTNEWNAKDFCEYEYVYPEDFN